MSSNSLKTKLYYSNSDKEMFHSANNFDYNNLNNEELNNNEIKNDNNDPNYTKINSKSEYDWKLTKQIKEELNYDIVHFNHNKEVVIILKINTDTRK